MNDQPPQILIIDDNVTNLKVASMHLSDYAYVVLTARSGDMGFRRALHTQPDLILLDIQMPGIDGYETCRRLKANPATSDIPVIYMTARADLEDKLKAFALGGVDYITKPFEARELLARVRTHLQLVLQQRQIERHADLLQQQIEQATMQLRNELEERRKITEERERLQRLVRLQNEQLYEQTRRWLESREDRDHGLAKQLRLDVNERIRLAVEALVRVQHAKDDAPEGTQRAIDLLSPALSRSEDVSSELGTSMARDEALINNPLMKLSGREYEVFQLLAEGKSNKEITYTIGVAASTVSTYRMRIFEKLGVEDIASLVHLALKFSREA
ncbi:MAG: response regulator [Myxococcota bacterium]